MNHLVRNSLILLILFITQFYFLVKLSKTLPGRYPKLDKLNNKYFKTGFLILINLYPLIFLFIWAVNKMFSSSIVYPESLFMDNFIVLPFWIVTLIILQSDLFFLTIDILKLLIYPFLKKYREKISRIEKHLIFAVFIVFLFYVPVRVYYDWNTVSVRVEKFSKPGLPSELDGFRIVFISDIQVDRYTNHKRVERYIEKVNALNPDLVLMGGDVITGSPDYIEKSAEYIGKINSIYGVYSCIGDHDNWAYRENTARSRREVTQALASQNVKMIDNDRVRLIVENSKIDISFITNTYVQQVSNSVLDSLSRINKDSDLNIFLTHQPRENLVNKASKAGFDLMLAGHTHGGQVTLLYPFLNITPTMFETKYIKGDFNVGKMRLVVTRGLGMSLAPVRYNATPEITVIILESGNPD